MVVKINIGDIIYSFTVTIIDGDGYVDDVVSRMHIAYHIEVHARKGKWSRELTTHIAYTDKKYTWSWILSK